MPSTTNLEENSMEGSPLMNPKQTPLHSSINPEKLDQSRFSEMRNLDEEKTSPVRIIIYAVIIILLGVAAAFLVRTLIANNQQEPTDTQETVLEEDNNTEPVSAYAVSLTAKNDSAATNVGANDEYVDSETVTLGVTTLDMTKVELAKINYDKYTTFARVKFDFEGNTNKTPKTTINFANNNLEVSVLESVLATGSSTSGSSATGVCVSGFSNSLSVLTSIIKSP